MRLHKPVGTLLLLWPTLIALIVASNNNPSLKLFILFSLGALIMRSAGCVINDLIDKDIDKKVSRTKFRPIASGQVSSTEAIVLFFSLIVLALVLLFQLNQLSFYVSFAILFLIIIYPFSKRFFKLPQIILGFTFSGGIPIAFAATINTITFECLVLMLANFLWIMSYDTSYDLSDRDDDKLLGIGSSAIFFEGYERASIFLFGLLGILLFGYIGFLKNSDVLFFILFFVTIIFFLYIFFKTNFKDPSSSFSFFEKNNALGFLMFISFLTLFLT